MSDETRWPTPARTPNTEVTCDTSACFADQRGKKLAAYPPSLRFVGRFLDSVRSDTEFSPYRTLRANHMRFAPERNRIYFVLGSTLCAYNADTFFSRVASEPMVSVQMLAKSKTQEGVLRPDRMFYPEHGFGGGGGDGEERLYKIDYDDRGYVYLTCGAISWGIVEDDGGTGGSTMATVYAHTSRPSDIQSNPSRIVVVKTSAGRYFALVASFLAPGIDIYDVSDPTAPVRTKSVSDVIVREFSKSEDGTRVAVLFADGMIRIYSADSIAQWDAAIPWCGQCA